SILQAKHEAVAGTARMRMLASKTIISASCVLSLTTQRLDLDNHLLLINVRQRFRKSCSSSLKFSEVRCLRLFPPGRNVYTESLAVTRDGNRCVRFQEARDPLPKLAHTDFNRGHSGLLRYPQCTPLRTQLQSSKWSGLRARITATGLWAE